MTIYNIADFLTGIIESLMMFMLYNTFLKKRENLPAWVYGIGVIALAIMINASNTVFNYGILNAVGMIFSFFMISFLYKGKVEVKAILSVLSFLLIGIIEITVLYILVLIFKISVETAIDVPEYRLLGIIISKMLTFMSVYIIRLKFKKKQILFRTSYWVLFLVMFSTSVVAVFLIFKLSYNINEDYMYNLSVLCSFGLLFSTFFALYLYEHLAEQSEIIHNQQKYEQHLKEQVKHLDEIFVAQKQLKKFKHDFSHYIIGLQAYVSNKDYSGVEEYLESLAQKFSRSENIIETGNIALDAVLSAKKALAESKDINFNTKIQIPERLPIEPIDLCVIFGNALDNAIEACERGHSGHKEINLTIICQKETLFCKIVNTAPFRAKLSFETVKADKNNHGFGLENIKTALAKYDSEPATEYTDNQFTLKFIIFLK